MLISRSSMASVLLVALLAGCAGNPAARATPTLAGTPPAETASPVPATSAPSTLAPGSSVRPSSPGPLTVGWTKATGVVGLADLQEIRAWTTFQGRFILVGRRGVTVGADVTCCISGIWTSEDGLEWVPADVADAGGESVDIQDVTAGGPGLVAVGDEFGDTMVRAAVWTSTDGRRWQRVLSDQFSPGRMSRVGATNHGLVAIGDDCSCIYSDVVAAGAGRGRDVVWTSPDGVSWHRDASRTGLKLPQAVGVLVHTPDDELTAFATAWDSPEASRPIEVWRTTGGIDPKRVGELPDSLGADVGRVVSGPNGWIAMGTRIWASADGINWTVLSPNGPPGTISDLQALPNGFIAVGARSTATGCATFGGDSIGLTWASPDGKTWTEIRPKTAWQGQGVRALFQRDETVIGVGLAFTLGGGTERSAAGQAAVWTATESGLSAGMGQPAPTTPPSPKTTPPSPSSGCGS